MKLFNSDGKVPLDLSHLQTKKKATRAAAMDANTYLMAELGVEMIEFRPTWF